MFARPSVALYLQVKELLKIGVSHIAIRLAGCPEALHMSRPRAPHPVPSLSVECAEPLRARCPHAPWCLPNFDNAKLVNIFHTTKYFAKNFQNIFNYFFSLPREKVFPAQRAKFS